MRLLKRADFVGPDARKRRYEDFPCPWDSSIGVRLQSLTAKEHGEFEAYALSRKGGIVESRLIEMKRRLISMTVVDGQNQLEMTDAQVAEMEGTDGGLVNWVNSVALKHCRITESEFEDLAKNSGAIGGDSSASDSPKNSKSATPTLTAG